MLTRVSVLCLLVVGGLLLRPVEALIGRQQTLEGVTGVVLNTDIRAELPQELAIGFLAGFRGLAADFLWIQSHANWEQKRWLRQYRNLRASTVLQPESILFWDLGAWQIGWNIALGAKRDPDNRSQAEGLKRERQWLELARKFLAEGIEHNPDHYELYFSLGWLHWKKLKNPCMAKDYFAEAAQRPRAPNYVLRMYARMLEECGDPRAAYEYWKRRWRNGNPEPFNDTIDPYAVIPREMKRLEHLLNIPEDQRVFPHSSLTHPAGSS